MNNDTYKKWNNTPHQTAWGELGVSALIIIVLFCIAFWIDSL